MSDADMKTRVTAREELQLKSPGNDCVVVIYTSDPRNFGKRYVLSEAPLTVGRGTENSVMLDNDSVSRRHCHIERRSDQWWVVDLESTNGTYVNDLTVQEAGLRPGDQIKVGDSIFKYLAGSDVEAQFLETVYRMTIVDGLTDVHNKRYLMDVLDRELPRAKRHMRPLTVVMLDIDHFKKINDTFGHLAGDYVLKEVAGLIKNRLRPDDVFGRFGGEEFCALLPETQEDGARSIAEDLRKRIEQKEFVFDGEKIAVTVSLGVAELAKEMDVTAFLSAADEKLYDAKRNGRNQVG